MKSDPTIGLARAVQAIYPGVRFAQLVLILPGSGTETAVLISGGELGHNDPAPPPPGEGPTDRLWPLMN